MKAVECQGLFGVDKGSSADRESGQHAPSGKRLLKNAGFLQSVSFAAVSVSALNRKKKSK